MDLLSIHNPSALAEILGVTFKGLNYLLYGQSLDNHYNNFEIPKKNGGQRKICAPKGPIKGIQRKLSTLLLEVYNPKFYVHSFCLDKSIVSNASEHIRKRFVLNIDLKNFFPSINFGRVRGMFMSFPFNFPENVATLLAQLCCYNNKLPQGAPTSPIVSNFICARLDSHLYKLAKGNGMKYSRYADDLTFSSNLNTLPVQIAQRKYTGHKREIEISEKLNNIIHQNGFEINLKKVRLSEEFMNQKVTGITVNEKLNLSRQYLMQIRSMLYSWQRYGLIEAEKKHCENHCNNKYDISEYTGELFSKIVNGKICYLSMVKGKEDLWFRRYINSYYELMGFHDRKYKYLPTYEFLRTLWVIECPEDCPEKETCTSPKQGTAFALTDVGLITCAHTVCERMKVFKCDNISEKYDFIIKKKQDDLDYAVLDIECNDLFALRKRSNVIRNDKLTISGFPGYSIGQQPSILHDCIVYPIVKTKSMVF